MVLVFIVLLKILGHYPYLVNWFFKIFFNGHLTISLILPVQYSSSFWDTSVKSNTLLLFLYSSGTKQFRVFPFNSDASFG